MKRLPHLTQIASYTAAALLLPLAAACAAQLDWDTVAAQTNGQQNYTFTIGGTTQVNVVISNPTSGAFANTVSDGSGVTAPAITQDLVGGTNPVQKSLAIAAQFTTNTDSLTVTVSFKTLNGSQPQSVTGVNFDLYDIDLNGTSYIDQIRNVQAILGSNTTIKPTQVTGSVGNTVTGNSTTGFTIAGAQSVANTGTTSDQANANINFGGQTITGFSFTYGDTTGAQTNPIRQVFALHDINFTPIPEPGTVSMIGLGGLLAGFVFFRRRSQFSAR